MLPSGIIAYKQAGAPGMIEQSLYLANKGTSLTPSWAIPPRAGQLLTQAPIVSAFQVVGDFWRIVAGTREDKLKTVTPYLPVTITKTYKNQNRELIRKTFTIETKTKNIIDMQKEKIPGVSDYWNERVIVIPGVPPVQWPKFDFGDIGKYLLIGAVAIGGLFLLGKYIGRK